MRLHFQSYGSGNRALVILHGLLGSSDNWHTIGRVFGNYVRVFTVDARNHGRSPHSEIFNYKAMAEDVREFLEQQRISSAHLLGHSMGGKTAMQFALTYPTMVDKLVVVDIAPRAYESHHDYIFDAISSLGLNVVTSRKEIDAALATKIASPVTRQFVMKNLARDDSGTFRWKLNLNAIGRNYDEVNKALDSSKHFDKPTLFVKSNKAGYITADDEGAIQTMFPRSKVIGVDVGHWIHAEAPEEFARIVLDFLNSQD